MTRVRRERDLCLWPHPLTPRESTVNPRREYGEEEREESTVVKDSVDDLQGKKKMRL